MTTEKTMTAKLPDVLAGHWATPEGLEMARRYAGMHRMEVMAQNQTDMEVANAAFMDPSIMNLTVAKDRIRWLSVQLALANAGKAALLTTAESLVTHLDGLPDPEDIGACLKNARAVIARAKGEA